VFVLVLHLGLAGTDDEKAQQDRRRA